MKVAIIGAGIAGLGCAHKLSHDFDLTIFESADYLGGHTNTIDVDDVAFDTGFMVYNQITYPNLTALFAELNVPVKKTDMSFSVQYKPDGIEWNGAGLNRVFAQRRNLFSFRFWKMLLKLDWFNKNAYAQLNLEEVWSLSVRQYVEHFELGDDFLHWYLIPMAGAVWSTPPDKVEDFPITTLIRFFHNHGFLGLDTHFQWYTVDGGAREYVKRLVAALAPTTRYAKGVVSVRRGRLAEVRDAAGAVHSFDKVIFACHADQVLQLIEPTALEKELLSPFQYQSNHVTVHTDRKVMPREKNAWASWNYRVDNSSPSGSSSSTHYWMNNLQGLNSLEDYFVSLNSVDLISPESVVRQMNYSHPLFDLSTFKAQPRLPMLNQVASDQQFYFCGSYFRYGFHEDALASAVDLSHQLLASRTEVLR